MVLGDQDQVGATEIEERALGAKRGGEGEVAIFRPPADDALELQGDGVGGPLQVEARVVQALIAGVDPL